MNKPAFVRFLIWLNKGVRSKIVVSKLQKISKEIKIINVMEVMEIGNHKRHIIACETDQETYEKIFQTKISFKSRKRKGPAGTRIVGVWSEDKLAKIPQTLEGSIHIITLRQKFSS